MSAIKYRHLIGPSTILNLGHFCHQTIPTIQSLVYKSAQHPISLEQTDDFMITINQYIQYQPSNINTNHPFFPQTMAIRHGSTMDPPWIPPSVAGRDLHNRLSAAAATLSRLQQLALEALPFLYAENGLGRVWSETFGALGKWWETN